MNLTPGTILALSPASRSATNGQRLATAASWRSLNAPGGMFWGRAQGNGQHPYLVRVDLNGLASRSSCPSREFSCQHALALMLLSTTHAAEPTEDGNTRLKSPSGSMSIAGAISVMNQGLYLAAHFGNSELSPPGHRRRPDRGRHQRPGARRRDLARLPGNRSEKGRRLERPVPGLAGGELR